VKAPSGAIERIAAELTERKFSQEGNPDDE
jgi:hypothetical protein